jgi:fumarate reductase subunit C
MLRVVAWVFRFYFSLLLIYLLCCYIAGPKNAAPWFVFVSLTLLGLTACGAII